MRPHRARILANEGDEDQVGGDGTWATCGEARAVKTMPSMMVTCLGRNARARASVGGTGRICPPPAAARTEGSKLYLVRLQNILRFQPRPFDPTTHDPDEDAVTRDETSADAPKGGVAIVRWREAPVVSVSNARVVKWSDGSMTLYVGNEALNAQQISVPEGSTCTRSTRIRTSGATACCDTSCSSRLPRATPRPTSPSPRTSRATTSRRKRCKCTRRWRTRRRRSARTSGRIRTSCRSRRGRGRAARDADGKHHPQPTSWTPTTTTFRVTSAPSSAATSSRRSAAWAVVVGPGWYRAARRLAAQRRRRRRQAPPVVQ